MYSQYPPWRNRIMISIDITIALPILTVPGITLHHLVVGLETSVCNLGHRQLFVVSLQRHKTGILHYGNRRTGYCGSATKGVGVCSQSIYTQEMRLRSYSILSSYLLTIIVISSYLLSPLSLLSLSSSLPLSLSLSLTTVKVVIKLIPAAVVVAIVAWLLI